MSIDIANESSAAVDEAALAALARHVLDQMRIHPLAELSVLLVDEQAMADLHERWMNEPGPTDVLAFPMDEFRSPQAGGPRSGKPDDGDQVPEPLLGDVVLCPQVAAAQASAAGHATADELELLCTHGILHLLGYDHASPDEHAVMFGLQERILASWREPSGGPSGGPSGEQAGSGTAAGGRPPSPGGHPVPGGEQRSEPMQREGHEGPG